MKTNHKAFALVSTSALAAGAAHGAIIYTPVNASLAHNSRLNLDLNQDGTPDFQLLFGGTTSKPYITNTPPVLTTQFVLSSGANQGLPLTGLGTNVDASYQSGQPVGYFNQNIDGTTVGGWTATNNVEGYVGLGLQDGSGTHYGWAHLIYNSSATPPNNADTGLLTLLDTAMETTPNAGIKTGQTAEPGVPVIVAPPAAQTGYLGGTSQFTVIATGNPAPTYQWRAGAVGSGIYTNILLGGRVTATNLNSDGAVNGLSLSNLRLADAADVVVVVSNSFGAVTSSVPARLTVLPTSDFPATLVHRYSFQDPTGSPMFADSVGGPDWDGTLQGNAFLSGSNLVLDGSSGTYATLPSGITSNYTQITVEFWADVSVINTNYPWTRVFSFGDQTGTLKKASGVDFCPYAPGNYQNLDLLDTSGNDVYANNNAGLAGAGLTHVTVVVDPPRNAFYYYNGATVVSTLQGAVPSLANINDPYNLIGASLVAVDPCLMGTVYEFRVYQGVLPAKAVALNDAVGPANYVQLSANPDASASLSGTNLVLTWPVSDYGFALQAKSGVTSAALWSTLTNKPTLVGTNWEVSVPATGAAQFFRLIGQ
ncbi:MAG TPA: immunoglobulin domain-containing protein [Candidatus Acidoferrum sp.]|nr:immunoglobulin domain-containing protein [Candidatus Acidoferrum sp.]